MATAAPVDIVDTLSKEFECSVCMDRLRDARCLFCQHTFCFACLESCVQSGREAANVITCPVCRVVTRLPRDGVAGLKGNALINSVLGKLEEWDKANHGSNSRGDSKSQASKRCESCRKPGSTAKYSCRECKKDLCLDCVQAKRHQSHHKTSSGPDADQNCEVHCWLPAKSYCFQCDKLCCSLCKCSGNTIPLHQKAYSVRALMQVLVNKCSSKSYAIQTLHHVVNTSRENSMGALQKSMGEVRQKAEKVISKVRVREEELVQYLQALMNHLEEEMGEKQNECSSLEDGLQAAVTEWQTLQESSSDAAIIRKHGNIEKKMNDLLAATVNPMSELCEALMNPGIQFIPGKLYLEASCSGSELGKLEVRPKWEPSHYIGSSYDLISQLMYMHDGTLLIADTYNGIDAVPPDHSDIITTFLDGEIVRDLTLLAGRTIVYQNNEKEVFKIVDNSSKQIHGFDGKWVSVTCCRSEGQDLIVVANQKYHDQDIVFMDMEGNVVRTFATAYIGGVRHLRFDKSQNAIFIDQNRRGVRCQRLHSDGVQKFVIAEEDTVYLALACHQSDFLYVASQKATAPNVVNIRKHSLEDGSLLGTLVAGEEVQNSFRMVMANWKDEMLAFSEGNRVVVVLAETDANAATVLQL